jgi:hypothetical protein
MRLSTQLISRLAPAKMTSPAVSKVTKSQDVLTRFGEKGRVRGGARDLAGGAPERVNAEGSSAPVGAMLHGCKGRVDTGGEFTKLLFFRRGQSHQFRGSERC